MIRITAGEFGGRQLAVAPAGIRPTTSRSREAIFSMLGPLDEMTVLDLFCGTGSLGIEALSRGASAAVFVDTDTTAVRTNLEALGLVGAGSDQRVTVESTDAIAYLARSEATFDVVFCDPPYRLAARLATELNNHLMPHLADGARIVTDSGAGEPLELGFEQISQRRYGASAITIHSAQPKGNHE